MNKSELIKERKSLLLDASKCAVGIYQLKDEGTRDIRFMNFKYLEKKGISPDAQNYELVYSYEIKPDELIDVIEFLDKVFEKFNLYHPADFTGRSLSVSDVILIREGSALSAFYVDDFGFRRFYKFGEMPLKRKIITLNDVASLLDRHHARYERQGDSGIVLYASDGTYTVVSIGDDNCSVSYEGKIIGDLIDLRSRL